MSSLGSTWAQVEINFPVGLASNELLEKEAPSNHYFDRPSSARVNRTCMITIVYGSILRPSSNNWASYLWLKWQIAALFLGNGASLSHPPPLLFMLARSTRHAKLK
jgi:hypothetical protein